MAALYNHYGYSSVTWNFKVGEDGEKTERSSSCLHCSGDGIVCFILTHPPLFTALFMYYFSLILGASDLTTNNMNSYIKCKCKQTRRQS